MSYNSELSASRALRLQKLCEELGLSSLVFILGLDSRRNKLDEKIFFWLFKGMSGSEKLESSYLPLSYEEVAWIVTPHSIEIFIGSACGDKKDTDKIYEEILSVSSAWKGANLYRVTDQEISDSEEAETTKVLWFIRRMRKLLGPTGLCGAAIETWPLIQAYALDTFGLGFFSTSHSPRDVSGSIVHLFAEFDSTVTHSIIFDSIPRLENSFIQTADLITKKNYTIKRPELTEEQIAECIQIPFQYAMLQSSAQKIYEPRVKFWGNYREKVDIAHSHSATLLGVCGVSSLICGRTWFFVPHGMGKMLYEYQISDDIMGLILLYRAISKRTRDIINNALAKSETGLREDFLGSLMDDSMFESFPHLHGGLNRIKVELRSFDAEGNDFEYSPGDYVLHTVLVELSDIRGLDGVNLGNLLFAESFLIKDEKIINLTQRVEDLAIWDIRQEEQIKTGAIHRIALHDNITLKINDWPALTGSLSVYSDNFIFNSPRLGKFIYRLNEFSKMLKHTNNGFTLQKHEHNLILSVTSAAFSQILSVWTFEPESIPGPEPEAKQKHPWLSFSSESAQIRNEINVSGQIPMYIIQGLPVVGKGLLAEALAKVADCTLIQPKLSQAAHFNSRQWEKQLEEAGGKMVILVLPGFVSVQDMAHIIPDWFLIKGVIVKVHSDRVYESEHLDWLPGFPSTIYTANILVLEEGDNSSNKLLKRLKGMNSKLEVFTYKGVLGPGQARAILDTTGPYLTAPSERPVFSLQCMFVRCSMTLIESKLRQKMLNWERNDEGSLADRLRWEREMQVLMIKGCVQLTGKKIDTNPNQIYNIVGNTKSLYSWPGQSDELGILFIGRNLDREKLYEIVLDTRANTTKLPLKNRSNLMNEEVKNIENSLPPAEDFYFDGTYWIDPEGNKQAQHPYLEDSILNYLEAENEKIGDFNRRLQKEISILRKENEKRKIHIIF
jgi:hypothetical protein